jgi:hypothetical protein
MNSRFATVSEAASNTTHAVKETVETHPVSTALMVFGAGLGIGVLAGTLLAEATYTRPSRGVEALGQKVLDRLTSMMPEFSSFASR